MSLFLQFFNYGVDVPQAAAPLWVCVFTKAVSGLHLCRNKVGNGYGPFLFKLSFNVVTEEIKTVAEGWIVSFLDRYPFIQILFGEDGLALLGIVDDRAVRSKAEAVGEGRVDTRLVPPLNKITNGDYLNPLSLAMAPGASGFFFNFFLG